MLQSSEEICEALVRHVETTGSEVFEKTFVRDGKPICAVFCVIGPNAGAFTDAVQEWLNSNGFRLDY